MKRNVIRTSVVLVAMLCVAWSVDAFGQQGDVAKVDFSYAFAVPHRITIGRPGASDRTLLDLQPGSMRMSWSYENLSMPHFPLLSFKVPRTDWGINITPLADGKPFAGSQWTRLEGVLPALENTYKDSLGWLSLKAIGGATGGLVRIELANTDSSPHQFVVKCDSTSVGENPAWVDWKRCVGDNLIAGWNERADRLLILGMGADGYSLQPDGRAPAAKSMVLVWNVKPGEKREGWIVRPYQKYVADLPTLRAWDWAKEFEQAKQEWRGLFGRALKMTIPDQAVSNAYLACLGDLFIMREPLVNGYVGGVPGTEVYRAASSGEAGVVAVALDQNNLHEEALAGFKASLDAQESDGNWIDYRGWARLMWFASGFKTWMIMEHYRLTRDKQFLAEMYPRMLASSRWQEHQRATMRPTEGERPVTYGLMPRGFGDCGLNDDGDLYGIFYPHNIWSVYADRCTIEAAEILGKTGDLPELKKIYEQAYADLMASLDRGSIREAGRRWIPGTPGKTCGSHWGALNILFPCRLVPPDHELVTGTLQQLEANLSKGGLPLHLGWQADGLWVAIALDNLAEAHLVRGEGDIAAKYLYATLNHATPLYTWCEERGQEPGAANCTGDRQHLFTPVAVVRAMRDMLVMENGGGLDLALGTAREWLASGRPVGVDDACTHFGPVAYRMQYDAAHATVAGEVHFAADSTAAWSVLHVRLPGGLKIKSVNPESKAEVLPDGSGIRWNRPQGTIRFVAAIGA